MASPRDKITLRRIAESSWVRPFAFLILIIVLWDLTVRLFKIPPYLIPAPKDVIIAFWTEGDKLLAEAVPTTMATLGGFALSALFGIPMAMLIAGSRTVSAAYAVPLYGVPDDLLTIDLAELYPELKDKRVRGRLDGRRVVPYWPRADIESGKARIGDKALAYVADPVDAFFLQVQGSGRVVLADGTSMRVGYADQNGHPYRSIARVLVDRGELTLERASKQAIEAWGRANPDKVTALLDENPSFVFFREVPPPAPGTLEARIDGPIGALGVPLLAERTIAVDPRALPLGAPVFVATTDPQTTTPRNRLTLAQDTGGAIRGAVRADYFWGFGDAAGRQAGRMRQDGRLWVLWPKDAPLPAP